MKEIFLTLVSGALVALAIVVVREASSDPLARETAQAAVQVSQAAPAPVSSEVSLLLAKMAQRDVEMGILLAKVDKLTEEVTTLREEAKECKCNQPQVGLIPTYKHPPTPEPDEKPKQQPAAVTGHWETRCDANGRCRPVWVVDKKSVEKPKAAGKPKASSGSACCGGSDSPTVSSGGPIQRMRARFRNRRGWR